MSFSELIVTWCDRLIRLGFYLLFAIVPLLLTPWNYELFEYNKMMAVYALTAVTTVAWLVKMITLKEAKIAKTPLDIPILLFLLSQLISSLFSLDPHVSWFGYYSRFNGGMFSIISYVLLYYAFLSNLDVSHLTSHISRILKVSLTTAIVVALYGVAERLGIDKHLWVQDVQNRVFSTLGQPNWLAAYLVALSPIAWAFALMRINSEWKSPIKANKNIREYSLKLFAINSRAILYGALSLLFFLVLLFTRSRSGLLGFVVTDLIFWGLLYLKNKKDFLARLRLPFIIYHLAFIIILFFNGTSTPQLDRYFSFQGWKEQLSKVTMKQFNNITIEATASGYVAPSLESGGTESGVIRKYVWQGAINAWKSSVKTRLIGTGTETFAFAFYQFRPVEHNQTSEWDYLYNKAHNEYLNYLATTGILGLGSYLLFIGVFIWWFIKRMISEWNKRIKANIRSHSHESFASDSLQQDKYNYLQVLTIALFSGWTSVLVTNFFGFSVVVTQLFLFLFPAFIFMLSNQCNNVTMRQLRFSRWSVWFPVIVGLYVLIKLGLFWYADTLFAAGYRLAKTGSFAQAQVLTSRATRLNPAEPFYHDELGTQLASLAVAAAEDQEATAAAELARESLSQSDRALTISPKNVNFWKSRTKVFYTLSSLDPAFNQAAIEAINQAIKLSPHDPKLYYNLAILSGRQGQTDEALQYLRKSLELKPNYRDAYYALYVFYTETGKRQQAREILQEYLDKVDPNDQDFLSRIKNE